MLDSIINRFLCVFSVTHCASVVGFSFSITSSCDCPDNTPQATKSSTLLQQGQFIIRMPEPYSQRAGKLANQHEGDAFVLLSQIVEFFFRQHIEFSIGGGNRRVTARTMIKKRQTAKELTRAKSRDVTQTRSSSGRSP